MVCETLVCALKDVPREALKDFLEANVFYADWQFPLVAQSLVPHVVCETPLCDCTPPPRPRHRVRGDCLEEATGGNRILSVNLLLPVVVLVT